MHVAIIGYEVEGKSAYSYWKRLGVTFTICDQDPNKQIPAGIAHQLGPGYLKNLDRFDVIVRSAGVNPALILAESPGAKGKVTTVINEFLRVCPTKNVIGVTGTKGKGTTSTLIAKMLEAAGEEVYLGGNIGLPPLDFLPKLSEKSWVVLELSSFQLIDLEHSPSMAVCLMVVPEHLNWHADMDDYILAKAKLFEHQAPSDTAIYCAANNLSRKIANYSPGIKIPYFADPGAHVEHGALTIAGQHICQTSELKLLGEHNHQNVCAAVTAVWQVTQNITAIRSVLTNFSGLPHRLEFVRELDGVKYYDDSFGTTPETATVAIEAFNEPKVVILGGSDKGANFEQLARTVSENDVRQVVLIGNENHPTHKTAAPMIDAALRSQGFSAITPGGKTMTEIVQAARSAAQPGDVVLLSTACASFDMFKDYKDRGERFKAAVRTLV